MKSSMIDDQASADRKPAAAPAESANHRSYTGLRISFWCLALILGAAETWATRFRMNPDGISYLDIGDAYWRGDWHAAINAYWSPLYSWILGFFLKVLKPSAYWEFPVAHLVNFLIYVAALGCFEFFLRRFIAYQQHREAEDKQQGNDALPEWAWWMLGYAVFISSSMALIMFSFVTPDMCVAAFVYLAAGLLVRIRQGGTRTTFALLGMVLGFAYLAKSAMFLLAFPFFGAALLAYGNLRKAAPRVLLAAAIFLGISSPLIIALSLAKHRLTFGETGRIAYEVCVNGVDQFVPDQAAPQFSVRRIFAQPATYEFAQPIGGTYPLWYDTSYWHEGIRPRFDVKQELQAIHGSLLAYFWLLVTFHFHFMMALLALVAIAPKPSRWFLRVAYNWPLMIPAFAALGLYALVYTEYRYVAAFVLLLWLAAFSGVALPVSQGSRRLIGVAVIAIAATTFFFIGRAIVYDMLNPANSVSVSWEVAEGLNQLGIRPGDKLAVISDEPFGPGGAFVARLARAQVIAQVSPPDSFWAASTSTRAEVIHAFAVSGARAALASSPSTVSEPGWKKLGNTHYYVLMLAD
jgi:hypothetical protein